MKKLFLYLVLVGCLFHCVNAGMTDVARKSAMGIGGTTTVAALAMIIYQSHILKKLNRKKAVLESGALLTLEELVPVYQVETKIREADAIRAKAIAVLVGSAVIGGGGYFWPTQKQSTSPKSSDEQNQGLLSDRSSPASSGDAAAGANTTDGKALPLSLSNNSALDGLTQNLKKINNTQRSGRYYPLPATTDLDTYSFESTQAIDTALQMLRQSFANCSTEEKAQYKECVFWPIRKRTPVKITKETLSPMINAAFFVEYLNSERTKPGTFMGQFAVGRPGQQSGTLSVPIPLGELVDVVCVPGDGHCGLHIIAAHELLQSHPDSFSPLICATADKIYGIRADLAKWMKEEVTFELAKPDLVKCIVWDCLELRNNYDKLLKQAPWSAALFGRFKELVWGDSDNPKYKDVKRYFVQPTMPDKIEFVSKVLPVLLNVYDELIGCSRLDKKRSSDNALLSASVGSAYYLTDTEWELFSFKKQMPVILCKQEVDESAKPNGKYSFIRFFGKQYCTSVDDILSKALFACNVNGNHWITLAMRPGIERAAQNKATIR